MTDYELIALFTQVATTLQTTVMNFVAVLFAFLIAAYLIAGKLETKIVFIVVVLFTLITVNLTINAFGFGTDFVGLARQVAERAAQDPSGLGWHGTATTSHAVLPFLQFSPAAVVILSYLGGLAFFFHQRHIGRAQ